jgi:hypothetical protein
MGGFAMRRQIVGLTVLAGLVLLPCLSNAAIYGVDVVSDQLLTINPATGLTTIVGPFGLSPFSGVSGLAAGPAADPDPNDIPEPTTLVIWSLLATLGLSFYRRRRRAF